MTWGTDTWGSTVWGVDGGGGGGAPAVNIAIRRALGVEAKIDGRSVRLGRWSAEVGADWGSRLLTGDVPSNVSWATQEAPVSLWCSDGRLLWSGRISEDPTMGEGVRSIKARGYAEDLAERTTRMLYRIDGAEAWTDAESDPHGYSNSEKFDLEVRRGAIIWRVGDGDTPYSSGNQSAVVVWTEGALISRYSVLVDVSGSFSQMDLQTHTATGPSGGRVLEANHALNIAGSPTTYANNLNTPSDLLSFRMNATGSFTPAQKHRVKLSSIKLYGRTTDDAFSISDVVADAGGMVGFNTALVEPNLTGVLPLDWDEDHAALCDYMAELADWHWEAEGPAREGSGSPRLAFGPWGPTWTAYLGTEAQGSIQPLKRYNRVRVPYRSLSGTLREFTAEASPDPFPGREVVWTTEELTHPQSSSTLAEVVAATLMPYLAGRRVTSSVALAVVRDASGRPTDPHSVRPGSLLELPDSGLPPQRIVSMTYREGAMPTAELNNDSDPARLLVALRGKKKPKKPKIRSGHTGGPLG